MANPLTVKIALLAWTIQSGAALGAAAAGDATPASRPIHEFFRSGNGLGCTLSREETAWITRGGNVAEIGYMPCLTIGPIKLEMTRLDVEQILGPHNRIVPSASGEHRTYLIRVADRMVAYWVVTYVGDRVTAAQLTGGATPQNHRLSGLALGESVVKLVEKLGPPGSKRAMQESGAELWSYAPWPISFEIKAGVITSMRSARPGK